MRLLCIWNGMCRCGFSVVCVLLFSMQCVGLGYCFCSVIYVCVIVFVWVMMQFSVMVFCVLLVQGGVMMLFVFRQLIFILGNCVVLCDSVCIINVRLGSIRLFVNRLLGVMILRVVVVFVVISSRVVLGYKWCVLIVLIYWLVLSCVGL